ncbi:MAG: hypothetical protein HUU01_10415 [Saprospiraceae bacterium]|nr:hypothetical protein [Saprospiraceae bacterium]
MLTLVEKILFVIATLASLYFTYKGVMRIVGHISSGQGKVNWAAIYENGIQIAKFNEETQWTL